MIEPRIAESGRIEQIEDVMYVYGLHPSVAVEVEARVEDPYRVYRRRANLEDVFLTLTGHGLTE